MTGSDYPGYAQIDLGALGENIATLQRFAPKAEVMAVVKADAYGHGLELVSQAVLDAGVTWFGVAQVSEALRLRRFFNRLALPCPSDRSVWSAGSSQSKPGASCQSQPGASSQSQPGASSQLNPRPSLQPNLLSSSGLNPQVQSSAAPKVPGEGESEAELSHSGGIHIVSWIYPPEENLLALINAGIELSVGSLDNLLAVSAAAREADRPAYVHLKVDTGMGRAGIIPDQFSQFLSALRLATGDNQVVPVGIWSHLACGDDPALPAQRFTRLQIQRFEQACCQVAQAGFPHLIRHLSATSGIVWHPEAHYDLVRMGIGMYGLSPNPAYQTGQQLHLRPVMELKARLTSVKRVPAGTTVSYGATWTAAQDTWLGIVPLGYADGLPRQASGKVSFYDQHGNLYPQVGRICMDQCMVDLGPGGEFPASNLGKGHENTSRPWEGKVFGGAPALQVGQELTLFGTGPTNAEHWAQAAGTINYTIVTQIGPRVPRKIKPPLYPA